jgi:hypothetical protein
MGVSGMTGMEGVVATVFIYLMQRQENRDVRQCNLKKMNE